MLIIKNQFFLPRIITLLCVLFLCILILLSVSERRRGLAASALVRLSPAPALSSEAYLVRLSGEVAPLMAQRSGKRMAPASLTKIMTAFVARQILASDEKIVFSSDAKAVEEHRSDAAAGEIFLRDDVVRMALMESANDAALALAEAVGAKAGKTGFAERIEFFVGLMNERATALAMGNTHFENPVGLDAPGHTMSAEDLGRLVDYALLHGPGLFAATADREAKVFSSEGKKHTIENTDELLKEFPALAGGKTGFTDHAKGALLLLYPVRASASRKVGTPMQEQKKIAVIVILKSEDRFGDGRKIIQFLEHNFP